MNDACRLSHSGHRFLLRYRHRLVLRFHGWKAQMSDIEIIELCSWLFSAWVSGVNSGQHAQQVKAEGIHPPASRFVLNYSMSDCVRAGFGFPLLNA